MVGAQYIAPLLTFIEPIENFDVVTLSIPL
jgi:hypothetical protein